MRVIFFLSRFTKFFENVIENIACSESVSSVIVCYWKNDHLPINPTFQSYKVKCFEKNQLTTDKLFSDIELNLVYLPGWMDKEYLKIVKKARLNFNIATVAGFDDQWNWGIRKVLGAIYFRLFLRANFDFAWVAGPPQFMYARMFGFPSKQIGYNLLTSEFDHELIEGRNSKKVKFLFVGRLVKEKNLEIFLRAFNDLNLENCELEIVGDGYLEGLLKSYENDKIHFSGYLSPAEVADKMKESDVFVLPSIHEQWSVALHEACSNGMICLCSENVGANSLFLIHGFNGREFDPKSIEDMKSAIRWVESLNYEEKETKKKMSYKLSKRIDVEIVTSSFLSFGYKKC